MPLSTEKKPHLVNFLTSDHDYLAIIELSESDMADASGATSTIISDWLAVNYFASDREALSSIRSINPIPQSKSVSIYKFLTT